MKHCTKTATLPDVASQIEAQFAGRLDWVGMNEIELPVLLDGADGRRMQTTARVAAHRYSPTTTSASDRGVVTTASSIAVHST